MFVYIYIYITTYTNTRVSCSNLLFFYTLKTECNLWNYKRYSFSITLNINIHIINNVTLHHLQCTMIPDYISNFLAYSIYARENRTSYICK